MYLKISHTIQQNHQLQIINAFIHCLADNLFPWKKFLYFKKLLSIMQAIVQSARKTQWSFLPNSRLQNYNKSKLFFILEREMCKWDKTLISHIFFIARAAVVTNFPFKWFEWPRCFAVNTFSPRYSVLWKSICQSHLQPFLGYNNSQDYSIKMRLHSFIYWWFI